MDRRYRTANGGRGAHATESWRTYRGRDNFVGGLDVDVDGATAPLAPGANAAPGDRIIPDDEFACR
jgi:hypothetical protein